MQIRKLTITVLLLAFFATMLLSVATTAFAQSLDKDDFDVVFLETSKELYDTQDEELYLTANKELLLDIQLQPLGFVYDFTINGENGYAIIILDDDGITVSEFSLGAQSPYNGITGDKVYVCYLTYLHANNGELLTLDGQKPTDADINVLKAKAYKATGSITYSEERVTYTSKNVNKKNLAFRHPYITEVGGLSNACAPIAGANLIQYWDRFCENLIPDYTAYTVLNNQYIYKGPETILQDLTRQLYNDMSTNVTAAGTTEPQFKNGLETFCKRVGYGTVTFNTCMSNKKFSYSLAKQRIEAGQPLAIFVDTFTVANISEGETDFFAYLNGNGCHVMAGFGYREVSYILSDGTQRNDYYLAVASGYSMYDRSYFNVNLNTLIDDVFGVVIS